MSSCSTRAATTSRWDRGERGRMSRDTCERCPETSQWCRRTEPILTYTPRGSWGDASGSLIRCFDGLAWSSPTATRTDRRKRERAKRYLGSRRRTAGAPRGPSPGTAPRSAGGAPLHVHPVSHELRDVGARLLLDHLVHDDTADRDPEVREPVDEPPDHGDRECLRQGDEEERRLSGVGQQLPRVLDPSTGSREGTPSAGPLPGGSHAPAAATVHAWIMTVTLHVDRLKHRRKPSSAA